jgi:hypothetical protein
VVAGERELYERFVNYEDEELLRILTVERARYRREALVAAQMALARRGVAVPTLFIEPEPPATAAQGGPMTRPKRPYQPIDLCVDALLVLLAAWGWKKLWGWTEAPYWVWPLGSVAYWVLTFGFLCSVYSLRQRWRAKE